MDIATHIMNILSSQPMVIISWRISNVTITYDGLRFNVEAFKFRGQLEIIPLHDNLYDIVLMKRGKIVNIISEVEDSQLVYTIDNYIDKLTN